MNVALTRRLLLGLTVVLLAGCPKKNVPTAAGKLAGKNLLLITLDTTRADRLGCYGYKPAKTPTLDALAARGTLFEQALAQVPLTTPSHCSIMTGRYPVEHGVRDNGANALADTHPTLASIFKKNGYDTGAFLASFVLDSRFGLERGFDTYDDDMGEIDFTSQQMEWEQPADVVTNRALRWLDAERDRPFFCWVHYYDPHIPYAPPIEFQSPELEPYDGELAFIDAHVKRLLDWLERSKLTDRTLIIVVGDHGEAFGEHGEEGHSSFLYDQNLHVPLLFSCPGVLPEGQRVAAVARAFDVFPTALDLFGFPPPDGLLSRSLTAALFGGKMTAAPAYAESHYVLNAFAWAEQRALITDRWKYISSTKPELFDRTADPRERENLIASQPKVAAHLLSELKALYDSMPRGQAAPAQLDAAARKKLHDIGYVGGATQTKDEFLTEGLPDPKDNLELITKFKFAQAFVGDDKSPEKALLVIPLMLDIVKTSPNSPAFQFTLGIYALTAGQPSLAVDAFRAFIGLDREGVHPLTAQTQGLLAEALLRMHRPDEALKHLDGAITLDERNPELRFRYAQLLRQLGRADEAIPHYEKALELFPAFASARVSLSAILKHKGRTDEATRHLERAMKELKEAIDRQPHDAGHRLWLARAYRQLQRDSDALAQFREAYRLEPRHLEILLEYYTALESRGEMNEAEDVLRKATAWPELASEAHQELGALLGRQERLAEAVAEYERCIELRPTNAGVIGELSGYYFGTGRVKDAIRILKIGAEAVPDNVVFLNMLAKLLATCPDPGLRDGPKALALALQASKLTDDAEPSILATLAAAYAETGDFAGAIRTAERAWQLAQESGQQELARMIQEQLVGYRNRVPFRDPRFQASAGGSAVSP